MGVLFGSGFSLLMRYSLKIPAVLSFFWIATAVWMMLFCQMAVSRLDLFLGDTSRQFKHGKLR